MGTCQCREFPEILFQLFFNTFLNGIHGSPGAGRITDQIFVIGGSAGKSGEPLLIFAGAFQGGQPTDQKLVSGDDVFENGFSAGSRIKALHWSMTACAE